METVDFTWECWVYPTSTLEYQAFLDSRQNPLEGGDTTGYYFGTNFNTLTPIVYTNSIVLQATGDMTLNEWNHVALTRSSGTIDIWVNGVNRGSTTDSTNLTNQRMFIGGDAISNGLNLTGNLNNIRITKGVAVYTTNFTIPTTNFTVTQTANVNGNPSAEITEGQTQLLLNTNFGTGFLTDTSTNNFTVVNNGGVTSSNYEPFTPVPNPTPTPTNTSTPTNTPTPTSGTTLTITTFVTVETTTWTSPLNVSSVEYLIVAGGGGAGNGYDNAGGGGGGAGMVLSGTTSVIPGNSYIITVGGGGTGGADARANNPGTSGDNSVFGSITALGGGNGFGSRTGGSAGSSQVGSTTAATGGTGSGGGFGGKGGGGALTAGSTNSGTTGGLGGNGLTSNISGSNVTYGVGGNGANSGTQNPGVNGDANTGNGGRAGGATSANSTRGGNGGSGIVILKYYV
jgi:hypothetical protein